MSNPRFGRTRFYNPWASDSNPLKIGTFVRKTNKGHELTDEHGHFWIASEDVIEVGKKTLAELEALGKKVVNLSKTHAALAAAPSGGVV